MKEVDATVSLAGRVEQPRRLPLPTRIGGFGGVDGLTAYLQETGVTHLISATHPFAAIIARNAANAAERLGLPHVALLRPAWQRRAGDRWCEVRNIEAAAQALNGPARRVFLGTGRGSIASFACQPQHRYLVRLVDPPAELPLPNVEVEIARGPFTTAGDKKLLVRHSIDLVVSKNSGGAGARAKIDAARELGMPIVMVARPAMPERCEVETVDEALSWLEAHGALRGV